MDPLALSCGPMPFIAVRADLWWVLYKVSIKALLRLHKGSINAYFGDDFRGYFWELVVLLGVLGCVQSAFIFKMPWRGGL